MEGEKLWVNKSVQETEKSAQQKDTPKEEEIVPRGTQDEMDENGFFLEEQEEDDREGS